MLCRIVPILIALWGINFPSFGFNSPIKADWSEGAIVFTDNSVITGSLSYFSDHNIVLVKDKLKIATYPTQAIKSVRYYDKKLNINRYFVRVDSHVVDVQQKSNALLFEVVETGEIQILRLPKKYTNKYYKEGVLENEPKNYSYYFYAQQSLFKLSKFKKEVLPLLLQKDASLTQKLINEGKLNLNNKGHCIQLVVLSNQANTVSVSTSELSVL